MPDLFLGVLTGFLAALLLAGFAGFLTYRRISRLQARARHSQRLAELGTLTGGLAHEIKNPLSTVQLNLQLLSEDLFPDHPAYARINNRLGIVQRETSRLRDILEDFLRYAGKIELQSKPTDVNGLLEELVDFFMPQAQSQRVQLRLKRCDGALVVRLDAKLIKQAVLNLMINGLQAMEGRGGELILVACTTAKELLIEVIDTGGGIAPDAVERVFHAYYSTKKGGTGLGLAMARRIAEEHGGCLTVKSEPGKGSIFTLHLPM